MITAGFKISSLGEKYPGVERFQCNPLGYAGAKVLMALLKQLKH